MACIQKSLIKKLHNVKLGCKTIRKEFMHMLTEIPRFGFKSSLSHIRRVLALLNGNQEFAACASSFTLGRSSVTRRVRCN